MLRIGLVALAALGVSVSSVAQEWDERGLDGFDSIAVSGGVDLRIEQGDFRVAVAAADDEAAEIETAVRGRTLEIRYRPQRFLGIFSFSWGGGGEVLVSLPELVSLSASGGTDVETVGSFSGESLSVSTSGGSDVELNLAVDVLEITTSGGSDVELTGRARMLRATTSGGSDLDASGLSADEADIRSSGGSDIEINVTRSLVARASGGSDISYGGEPETVDVDSSGGADVTRR